MRRLLLLTTLALVAAGCGPRYTTTFHLPPDDTFAPEAEPPSRVARHLDVVIDDGTCGEDDEHPSERLDRVDVEDRPDAVVITVWMREDWRETLGGMCSGIGTSFTHRVRLPRPIGDRAVVDAGSEVDGWHVDLEPRTREARRRLRERYDIHDP